MSLMIICTNKRGLHGDSQMCKKLNRYARRKRDKKLDFIKGCHRKNFRLERYVCTYNAFPIITKIEKDTLHESKVRFPIKQLRLWYPEYFKFKYVRNTWNEYPEWKYVCIGYKKQRYWNRDHFSVELKNVKKFTLKTTTITKLFKKESGTSLAVMIS